MRILTDANALLAMEENRKRNNYEEIAKKQLMEQLEVEISESVEHLSFMIEKLPNSKNQSQEAKRSVAGDK